MASNIKHLSGADDIGGGIELYYPNWDLTDLAEDRWTVQWRTVGQQTPK